MIFLGTGAAEMIPNPFCCCEVCRYALTSADPKERRLRSSFLLNDRTLIDLGPDVNGSAGRLGISLAGVKHIFYTHLHADHFAFQGWETMRMCKDVYPYVNIYLSKEALEGITRVKELIAGYNGAKFEKDLVFQAEHLTPVIMTPYETIPVEDMGVTPLPTIHEGQFPGEHALNYLFEKNGKRLLYACDTGLYCEENYAFLRQHPLTTLILEGTFGADIQEAAFKHMTLATVTQMVERFRSEGIVTDETDLYITHIGHKGGLTHHAYQRRAAEALGRVTVAWDGLDIGAF